MESRNRSQNLIQNGMVFVNGKMVKKRSYVVNDSDFLLVLLNDDYRYPLGYSKIKRLLKYINIQISKKAKILDVGSSHGGFIEYFSQYTHNITAIEIDKEKVNYLKSKYNFLEIICADAFKIPYNKFKKNSFDIISIDVTTEPEGTLNLIKKFLLFLKGEGILIAAFKCNCSFIENELNNIKYFGGVVKKVIQLDEKKRECHVFISRDV